MRSVCIKRKDRPQSRELLVRRGIKKSAWQTFGIDGETVASGCAASALCEVAHQRRNDALPIARCFLTI